MRLLAYVITLSGLIAVPAWALETGNDYLPACRAALTPGTTPNDPRANLFRQGLCVGMVSIYMHEGGKAWCAPEHSTPEQGLRVLVNYLEKNPQVTNNHIVVLMAAAFLEAWPCKK